MPSPCLTSSLPLACIKFCSASFQGFPLGGSSLQSKVMRGSRTTFRYFFQKAALYSTRIPGFPLGEAVGFCRLKRSLHAFPFPYVKPSPCLKKNSVNFIFFGKNCQPLRGFPLGGSSLQSKVMRGDRTTFRHFFQKAALYSTLIPGFPFGEAVGFRRLKRSLQAFPFPPRSPPSKAFPPLLFLRCYIPAFVAPALPVRFNPRFSSYPLFSKTISPRNSFAPNRCFRRKHNYYLITFPKTPFCVPRFLF